MSARKVVKLAKKKPVRMVKRPRPTKKPGITALLTVVTLGVSDLARSRRFYCEGDAEGRVVLPR